ncbi:TlpA disulfide reductase family protein [Flavicella sp.]|uniref:TlpA family protein disulfide reductase n=1 Tax=Flavicella sp. TaxID=2957742 RepID=UPI003019F72E
MIKFIKKHWNNILFVGVIFFVLNTSTKEWLIKTLAFSPSVSSKEIVLRDYNWRLDGINTENIEFSDLKNKVIFVNFWATWCAPCRAEMPDIQMLVNKYKDKVAFVFVTQESEKEVVDFMKKYNYDLPVYHSVTSIPKELNTTNSIPNTYVINKKGKIVIHETGAVNWDSDTFFELMEALLKE